MWCGDLLFFQGEECSFSLLLFSSFALLIAFYFLKSYSFRWLFGVALCVFGFAGGAAWMQFHLQRAAFDFPPQEAFYKIRVAEKPEEKERSILCRAWIEEKYDSLSATPVGKKAFVYLAKDTSAYQIKEGDELLIYSRLAPPKGNRNFDEFDYHRYSVRKGVGGTGFVAKEHWRKLGNRHSFSLSGFASGYRERLLSLYRQLGFDGEDFAVLSALTVGYKEELSEEMLESYSVAGVSHILALSGLHIGLLYFLLCFVAKRLPHRYILVRIGKTALILAFLWAFAFFTGMSASVVRSVSMFSVIALAGLFSRQALTLNTVAMTAFFMLLVRPAWLFDIGFQLSFCAVAAILLFHPGLSKLFSLPGKAGSYVGGLLSVSVAAQLGTFPLVLLYFSRFSTFFLLSNLVVIPLVTVIVYMVVLMLMVVPFPFLLSVAAAIVKGLLYFLNSFVGWVEQLPGASIDDVWVEPLEVAGIYCILLLCLRFRYLPGPRNLAVCMVCILAVCSYRVAFLWVNRPEPGVVFYNVRGCPAVHCIASAEQSWLVCADSVPDQERLRKAAANFWRRHRLQSPGIVTEEGIVERVAFLDHILSFRNCRICMVSDNRWQNKTTSQPLSMDYLYLCKGYDGQLDTLIRLFAPRCIILDSSLPDYRQKTFSDECRRLGIRFLSLSEKGSVRFLL